MAGFLRLPLQNHPRLVFVRPRTTGVLGSRVRGPGFGKDLSAVSEGLGVFAVIQGLQLSV